MTCRHRPAHNAVSDIPRYDEEPCRFRQAVIVPAGNLGFPTRVTTRFLSFQPRNVYHTPRTRTYYICVGRLGCRSGDQLNVIPAMGRIEIYTIDTEQKSSQSGVDSMSTAARSVKNVPEKNVIELFDDTADAYDKFSGMLDSLSRPMSRWMAENLPRGRRALDIGCGTGRYSVLLADLCKEVVAIDPAPRMIGIAKRDRARSNVSYQVRDALDMTPEKDGLFDVAFALSCVFLMAKPNVILPRLAALVAPGGVLVIFDPKQPDGWGQENWQVNYAFKLARMAYDMTSEVETAVNVIRAFLYETWLAIRERSVPLSREDFRREYSAVLPGVTFEEDIFPGFFTARWQRPAD